MRRITKDEFENPIIKTAVNTIFMEGWNAAAGEEAAAAIERMTTALETAGLIDHETAELIFHLFDAAWEPNWEAAFDEILNQKTERTGA